MLGRTDTIKKEDTLVLDTTVQEANITYPTDSKLRRQIIERLWKMGEEAGIKWDRSYVRTVPRVQRVLRTRSNSMCKARRTASNKLKTLAGRLLRDFKRKATSGWLLIYKEELELFEQVLKQKKHDSNKIYSLHDPTVYCIAKGKAHRKWEYGSKASIAMLAKSGVLTGVLSHEENVYDGHTLPDILQYSKRMSGKKAREAYVDRGYRGPKEVYGTRIVRPDDRLPQKQLLPETKGAKKKGSKIGNRAGNRTP